MHCPAFIASSGDQQDSFGIWCCINNTSNEASQAGSCESHYTPALESLLARPLWQSVSSALAHVVPRALERILGYEHFTPSSLGFAQSTSINPLCIQCQGHNFTVPLERLILWTAGLCFGGDPCLYRVTWVGSTGCCMSGLWLKATKMICCFSMFCGTD